MTPAKPTATASAGPDPERLLREAKVSAVHLEMRDVYAVGKEDKDFAAWKEGFRRDPVAPDSWWRPWLTLVQEVTARGVRVRRARIVSEPVSEYIRFEYDSTFTNVYAGEQVRWLPRKLASDLRLPGNDCWIFDGEIVVWNYFSGDGVPVRPRGLCEDPEVIAFCMKAFEAVWDRAFDHGEFTV